ncbi:hypothetical protein EJ08DRAFT_578792 [Tothia fuscella]|uniref:Uncharacterized protein n=1 Tax=Tothia fuscella TaxID=1048955 RepID=A0A9P4P2W9_9PEZI|nr:hypothetical protein EJ08DRAFT_578792 [Tothia fuscella]
MRNPYALFSSTELATLILTASAYITQARAFSFTRTPPANLDISQLGRVGVAGDFDGVSLYQWVGQSQGGSNGNNGTTSLLSRYPNGAFATLQGSDAHIHAMCPFISKDGTLNGIVVGGNFTSLGGKQAQGIALVNATTGDVVPLPGLDGSVAALYCDQASSTVYVGGSFTGGGATNAIAWVTGWTNLPFSGFNGPVYSITKAPNGNIVFGGDFDGVGNSTGPAERDMQVIPVGTAAISSTPNSPNAGFSDPRNIICKTFAQQGPGNTWLLADNSAGQWTAGFDFGFIPTKLRLYNTNLDGRGTKTFRYTALPDGGIMNMTYSDPTSGQTRYCDARCPLPQNNQTEQDFRFVNNGTVGMKGFRIDISEWYGSGAGLTGIELFQDDLYSFAINKFNEQQCDGVSNSTALAIANGPWTNLTSPTSTSGYLTATLNGNVSPEAASVVFQPNIRQSGNYSVTVYTPGCVQDGTCATRGRVNITGTVTTGNGQRTPFSTEIYQTNFNDKYDQIFIGNVDASGSSFRPSVTLSPSSGQTGPLTVVAQRVRFQISSSSGGLNGLFEYNANRATIDPNEFSKSTIDKAGMSLENGASVNALAVQGKSLYVAGGFTSGSYANVFSVGDAAQDIGEGGLNNAVQSMALNNSILYLGGSFTGTRSGDTQGLKGVASYNTATSKWVPMGAGIDGIANYVVPFELNITSSNKPDLAIAVSGRFSQVLGFGNNPAFNASDFAVWVPSKSNWLHNLKLSTISLQGILTAGTLVPRNPPLFAGSVASQELSTSGAVEVTGTGTTLQTFPAAVQKALTSVGSLTKRAIVNGNVNGVVTGAFYNKNGLNLTVYGGHFSAVATNGTLINNLAIINGSNRDEVTGLAAGVTSESVVQALGFSGTSLFAGGRINGNVNGKPVSGLIVYDGQTANYAQTQPPALQGASATVNAIAPQPSTSLVFVGGDFNSAGSFDCPSLCIYDTSRAQWNSPGSGLGGALGAMQWVDNTHLLIAGNLTLNGNYSSVIVYDSKAQSFLPIGTPQGKDGSITAVTSGSSDGSQYWVGGSNQDGSALLEKYNGTAWTTVEPALGPSSVIHGLQIFTTTQKHNRADILAQNNVLLVMGQLNVTGFGNASAALFNGTAWTPYLLSTSGSGGGTLSQVFVENPSNFFKSGNNKLAIGFVILIALAIALAIIFLVVIAGILAERYRRRRDGYMPAPTNMPAKNANMSRLPPEHLFGDMAAGPSEGMR